jgi:hypothetical protein
MVVVGFKVLVAIITALLGGWLARHPVVTGASAQRFLGLALSLQVLPAVVLFIALYLAAGQGVPSDVPSYYVPAGHAALSEQLPYRDFDLSYGPLFAYVGAGLLALWDADQSFVLFGIALNAVTLVLWHQVALRCTSLARARHATLLYASSGHVLLQTLLGTNQIWVAAALAGSALLIVRNHSGASGVVQAVSISATKLLTLLFWPLLWLCAPRRGRWLLGAVLPSAGVFALFTLLGADILVPLRRESGLISSGNLPYLLEPLSASLGSGAYLAYDVLGLLGLAAAWLWLYRQIRGSDYAGRARVLPAGLALIGLLFMILSKKSNSGYEVFIMYPAMLVLAGSTLQLRGQVAFLVVFNALLMAEPSLWFRMGHWQPLSQWLRAPDIAHTLLFIAGDIVLVACYAFLAWLSIKDVQVSVRDAGTASVAAAPAILGATS